MPLITCPDCKKEISDSAPACPQCGRPMKIAESVAAKSQGVITCPDCGKEISDSAPACPHCGRPMKTATPSPTPPKGGGGCTVMAVYLIVSVFVVVFVAVVLLVDRHCSSLRTPGLPTASEYDVVGEMIRNGFVVFKPATDEVLVDPRFWHMAKAPQQEGMSRLFAWYMGKQHGQNWSAVKVVDKESGKVLAVLDSSKNYFAK